MGNPGLLGFCQPNFCQADHHHYMVRIAHLSCLVVVSWMDEGTP